MVPVAILAVAGVGVFALVSSDDASEGVGESIASEPSVEDPRPENHEESGFPNVDRLPDDPAAMVSRLGHASEEEFIALCRLIERAGMRQDLRDPALADRLKSRAFRRGSEAMRRVAFRAWVAVMGPSVVGELVTYLEHRSPLVREEALTGLARNADPLQLDALLAKLADRSFAPRHLVVTAVGEIREPRSEQALVTIATDTSESPLCRTAALKGLAEFDSARARAAIAACVDDANATVRTTAKLLQ